MDAMFPPNRYKPECPHCDKETDMQETYVSYLHDYVLFLRNTGRFDPEYNYKAVVYYRLMHDGTVLAEGEDYYPSPLLHDPIGPEAAAACIELLAHVLTHDEDGLPIDSDVDTEALTLWACELDEEERANYDTDD